jgi:hypothetical protein
LSFVDETRTCVDCRVAFTYTAGEQSFFAEKGFTDPPKRCKACREAKKARRALQDGVAPLPPAMQPQSAYQRVWTDGTDEGGGRGKRGKGRRER